MQRHAAFVSAAALLQTTPLSLVWKTGGIYLGLPPKNW